MSPNSAPGAVSIEKKEERDLSLLEQTLFWSKIATGLMALTYVSGYLIATTYLGTYGISADASEFLRAKYIYIGCQYWMFVITFGVIARTIAVGFDYPKPPKSAKPEVYWTARWAEDDLKRQARDQVKKELKKRSALDDPEMEPKWLKRHLRWVLVVALILALFAFEIMLMKPDAFSKYLPLQAIFLLSIVLYQITFYRQYSSKSYGWGLLYGNSLVERMRWIYGGWIGCVAIFLMVGVWFLNSGVVPKTNYFYCRLHWISSRTMSFWLLAIFLFPLMLGGTLFAALSTQNLKSRRAREERPFWLLDLAFFWLLGIVLYPFFICFCCKKFWGWCKKWFLKSSNNKRNAEAPPAEVPSAQAASAEAPPAKSRLKLLLAWLWHLTFPWKSIVLPLLAGIYCFFALWVLYGHDGLYSMLFLDYGALVLALVILTNILALSYMHDKMHQDLETCDSAPWHNRVLTGVAVTVLYVVSVFSFSYLIYPFIPFEKAGGRYSTDYAVTVDLNHSTAGCSSPALDGVFDQSPSKSPSQQQFLVLEEDANWTYFARSDDPKSKLGSGPDKWEWWALCKESYGDANDAKKAENCRPKVYAVNRRCIADTESTQPQ